MHLVTNSLNNPRLAQVVCCADHLCRSTVARLNRDFHSSAISTFNATKSLHQGILFGFVCPTNQGGEALTNWYEVKASGKSSLPVSYAQIRQELNAMRQVYSGLKSIGYTINYTLVTTSNVLLNETRSSIINTAKNYGIAFSHITPKYQIRNGEVYVKFVAKQLPSGAESILDIYKPVRLQSHKKNLKCPCEN